MHRMCLFADLCFHCLCMCDFETRKKNGRFHGTMGFSALSSFPFVFLSNLLLMLVLLGWVRTLETSVVFYMHIPFDVDRNFLSSLSFPK